MFVLIALLWCVYLSDCFVRLTRDAWMFRAGAWKPVRGFSEPDLQLPGGSLELAWTPLLPWQHAFTCSGDDLSLGAARKKFDSVRRHARWSRVASGVLFVWVMGVLSALVLADRFLPVMLPWTIAAVSSHVAAFVIFLRSYRRLYGARPPLETWLTLALSPVSLMRAPAIISVPAAAGVHPVAAAGVLCDDAEFLRIARLWYFDVPGMRERIEQIARSRNLEGRLLSGPDTCEPGVSHYCPRCHGTYRAAASRCTDCDEVPLEPLNV